MPSTGAPTLIPFGTQDPDVPSHRPYYIGKGEVMKALRKFFKDERGGEMPEYAVVVGLIIVVGAAIFLTLGDQLNTIFTALSNMLQEAVAAS
jgi:Flp pilus assembly pilin Flp